MTTFLSGDLVRIASPTLEWQKGVFRVIQLCGRKNQRLVEVAPVEPSDYASTYVRLEDLVADD